MLMQIPCAHHFGCQHFFHPLLGLVQEQAVVEHARGVEDASERRHGRSDRIEERVGLSGVRDIGALYLDAHTATA